MKKLIFLSLFIANYSFAQSVSIVPSSSLNTEILKIKKTGIGIDHRNTDGTVGIGTYVGSSVSMIQTHTNHPLGFGTNNSNPLMTLATNGNFGIGTTTPGTKLHVMGSGFFSTGLETSGNVEASSFTGQSINIGGGTTISKYFETLLSSQQIFGVVNNTCDLNYFLVTGVNTGDTVILNMESAFGTLVVANVRVSSINVVEVKFCNIGNSNTVLQTGLNMRFTVIK